MNENNKYDFILESYIEHRKYQDNKKADARRRFEKDLFCTLAVIGVAVVAIMISCLYIKNYLKEIMYALLEIAYGS